MVPVEMRELQTQLDELITQGFIVRSYFHGSTGPLRGEEGL